MVDPATALLHLGDLHAAETLLVAVIAFGPFVVLVAVVLLIRRRDVAAEEADRTPRSEPRKPTSS